MVFRIRKQDREDFSFLAPVTTTEPSTSVYRWTAPLQVHAVHRSNNIGSRRRCCCGDCWRFIDYFHRDDSTDIGSGWQEISGDWEIKTEQLYEPGNSGAIALGTSQQPLRSAGDQYVEVTANDFVANQQCTLYACVSLTGTTLDSYWKATYRKTGSGDYDDWEVILYKNNSPVATALMTPMPFYHDYEISDYSSIRFIRCYLCVDVNGNPKAGVLSGDEPAWAIELGGLTGRYYGVGHSNSIPTYLNDFGVYELHDDTKSCRDCWCPCCTNQLSPRLNATIVIDPEVNPNRADCLDGDTTDLLWQWEGGVRHHHGTITHVRGIYTNTFDIQLACDSTVDTNCSGQNIELTLISMCAQVGGVCGGGGCQMKPIAGSTCEPLRLIYGPFHLDNTNLSCTACYDNWPIGPPGPPVPPGPEDGSYYIEITEAVADEMLFADGSNGMWEDDTIRHWE